jgi:hypothetical protein
MTDRERLIELMVNADTHDSYECKLCTKKDTSCTRCGAEKLADYLLANGVIVPPNKGCTIAILTAIYALADMVNQFGYSTTFRKKEAVCDGGLSALENAFWGLEYCGCKVNSNGTISLKNLFEFQEKIKKEIEKYENSSI